MSNNNTATTPTLTTDVIVPVALPTTVAPSTAIPTGDAAAPTFRNPPPPPEAERAPTEAPSAITDNTAARPTAIDAPFYYENYHVPTFYDSYDGIFPDARPTVIHSPEYNSDSNLSAADIAISFAVLWIIIFFLLFLRQIENCNCSTSFGNNTSNSGDGNSGTRNNDVTGYSSGLKFNSTERIELYNRTFDSNGNQLILEDKHIKTKAKSTTTNGDGNIDDIIENNNNMFIDIELADAEGNEHVDNDDDPSIYLSVESERRLTCHQDDDEDLIKTVRQFFLNLNLLKGNNNKEKQMISGTCIICFEELIITDVIVWSEDPKCSHVYHKECMVNYLASNAQREIYSTLDVNNNPCPTCRQNYCTVTDEDLVKQEQEQRRQEKREWYLELD